MVIQGTGSVDDAFKMALASGRSITTPLEIGDEIDSTGVSNRPVVAQFNTRNKPATALLHNEEILVTGKEGIGWMIIQDTFIVG